MKTGGLVTLVLVAYALHQDVWLFARARPLLFGFLPVGLAYHALYTLGCAGLMALLVRFAWPEHLEDAPREPGPR
jgi:hypothetical protein